VDDHARLRAAVRLLYARVDRSLALALNNLAVGVVHRIALTAAGSAEAAASVDDLAPIVTLWPNLVQEHVANDVRFAFDLGTLAAASQLPEALRAGTARYGVESIQRVVNHYAEVELAAATNRLNGIGELAWSAGRDELLEGFSQGDSVAELRDRLTSTIRGMSDGRAEVIARTEVIGASNAGSLAQVEALGEFGPKSKRWLATLDNKTRPTHAAADGQVVPVKAKFDVGGFALARPHDPSGPASETVNCRCTLTWVEKAGEQSEALAASGEGDDMTRRGRVAASTLNTSGTMTVQDLVNESVTLAVTGQPVTGQPATGAPQVTAAMPEQFHALLMVEDTDTGDGRRFAADAGVWRNLPLPLRWCPEDLGMHDGAVLVGSITRVQRQGTEIHGYGHFDDGGDYGAEVHRQIGGGFLRGISADLDDVSDQDVELIWPQVDPSTPPDEVMFMEPETVLFNHYRIMGATVLTTPALQECFIETLSGQEQVIQGNAEVDEGLYAAGDVRGTRWEDVAGVRPSHEATDGIPVVPPFEWFQDPQLTHLTALQVSDDGRVYGHGAEWGTCHTSFPGACITPPVEDEYDFFTTGEVLCAGGERVPVGQITISTNHAPRDLRAGPTIDHYDHTGSAVADVFCGSDAHGIWVAGALRPGTTPEQTRVLRASPLSGDWRRIGGRLRLVAMLCVNVPGFPVPRARIVEGVQTALVAAGAVSPERADAVRFAPDFSALADRLARTVGRDRRSRAAELAARVRPG
jgi:hypothetical protein